MEKSGFNVKPFLSAGSFSVIFEEHFSTRCFLPVNVLTHSNQVTAQSSF